LEEIKKILKLGDDIKWKITKWKRQF
jgi:hypothetical protein